MLHLSSLLSSPFILLINSSATLHFIIPPIFRYEASTYPIMCAQFLEQHGVSVDVVEMIVMDVLGNQSVIATPQLIKEVRVQTYAHIHTCTHRQRATLVHPFN